ncbi:hypothetical protein [Flavobacterium suzhouense]|uniref:YD repeat-containing protein n=1 Tax=Flavobacterium suzhouense TaxID=1529638 RepID=A0ABW5NTJ5_9FLAO
MIKLKYFSILYFLCTSVSAQSIYTALHHDSPDDLRKGISVSEITENSIIYDASGAKVTKKEVTLFNNQNRVTSEVRYDDSGKMTDRLTFMYDSTGVKKLARKFEHLINAKGFASETAFYEYDNNGFFIGVIDKNQQGKVVSTTKIINNEKGYPIELKVTTDRTDDFGKEVAEYDFQSNSVMITSIGPRGNVISTHKAKIDDSIYDKDEVVNENGDLVKSDEYYYKYVYDKNLNWIKQTRYKIVNGKQVKDAEFTRNIKYSKN